MSETDYLRTDKVWAELQGRHGAAIYDSLKRRLKKHFREHQTKTPNQNNETARYVTQSGS